MDIESIAVELYQLPPDRFTAARNARAGQLAADGDRELANVVRKLPKAPATAWALNRLSNDVGETKDEVVQLGAAFDAAYVHPDRQTLSDLNDQRKSLVGRSVARAVSLADEQGVALSGSARIELEQTLTAAIADPGAAAAVFSGRLVRPLQAIGLDQVVLAGAVGGPEVGPLPQSPKKQAKSRDRARQDRDRTKALEAATRAERAAAEAEKAVTSVEKLLQKHDSEATELAGQVDDLRARLETLQARQRDLRKRGDELHKQHKTAADALRRARSAADAAQEEVARLQDGRS